MSQRCKYGENRDGSCRRRAQLGAPSGRGRHLDLELIRAKKNPCAVKVKVTGRVGKIQVRGETTSAILIGIDRITPSLVHSTLRLNRAEGGRAPSGTRATAEKAVFQLLKDVTC